MRIALKKYKTISRNYCPDSTTALTPAGPMKKSYSNAKMLLRRLIMAGQKGKA
jgi:hypothetical protein